MPNKIPILCGDIGGTKSHLCLMRITSNPKDHHDIIDSTYHLSFNFKNVSDLLSKYLSAFISTPNYPVFAVFSVPGPITNNSILQFTNVPHWPSVNGNELSKKLNIEKLIFLNDFVANGYAIQTNLKKGRDYRIVNDKEIDENGPKCTLGPGTGFGVGYLTKKLGDKYHLVCGAEGSHSDFAPINGLQFKYKQYLARYYNIDHISMERAICGQSIIPIYKFLSGEIRVNYDYALYDQVRVFQGTQNSDTQLQINKLIVQKGLRKECKLCEKTLEFFVELYGQAAGNACLMYLPTGGLYLLGGLSDKFQDLICETDIWKKSFFDKGRMSEVMESFPVILVKDNELTIKGCIEYCRRLIEQKEENNFEGNNNENNNVNDKNKGGEKNDNDDEGNDKGTEEKGKSKNKNKKEKE